MSLNRPCLKEPLLAYSEVLAQFPTDPATGDNSWFLQPLFNNTRIKTKISKPRKDVIKTLAPADFGLPDCLNLRLHEVFQGGVFKSFEALETTCRNSLREPNFSLQEGPYLRLKNAMQRVLGQNKTYQGVTRVYSDVIPLMNPNPPEFSYSSLADLLLKTKKGSGKLRKILSRGEVSPWDEQRLRSWENLWNTSNLEINDLETAMKFLCSNDFTAQSHDTMMRFVHRKTLFGKQFHRVYPDPHNRPDWAQETRCSRCIENHHEDDEDPPEDTPQHHVLTCPYIGNLRYEITSKFNLAHSLTHSTNRYNNLFPTKGACAGDYILAVINTLITVELLGNSLVRPTGDMVLQKILKELRKIMKHKPLSKLSKIMHSENIFAPFEQPRPPEP